ncbi:uncharacterized protein LOC105843161 [Hydra vulgaris]|uniref:uncharacterized protein LOC105843161 n=1 Tax=Hydra vulgaris TaxID=6087 RepID=UPI001F5F1A0B|nr:uncharacterized protein LOC105843161 [Hydra vulgaris]
MFQNPQMPFLTNHFEQYNNALSYPPESTFMGMLQSPYFPHSISTDYRYFNAINLWPFQQPFLQDQNHMLASLPSINAPSSSFLPIPGNYFTQQSRMTQTEKFDLKIPNVENAENNINLDSQTVNRLKREFSYINTDGFRPDDVECLSFSSLLKPKISFGNCPQRAEKCASNKGFCLDHNINMTKKVKNCAGTVASNLFSNVYDTDSSNVLNKNAVKLKEKRKRKKSVYSKQCPIIDCSKKKVKDVETVPSIKSNSFTTSNNFFSNNNLEKRLYYENNEFYGYTQYLRKLASIVSDVNFDDRLSQLFYNQLSRPFEDTCMQSLKYCERNVDNYARILTESKKMQSVYADCSLSMQYDKYPLQMQFDQAMEYSNPILMKHLRLSVE